MTMEVSTNDDLGRSYVSLVRFTKQGCPTVVFNSSKCEFLYCPSALHNGVSINFMTYQFSPEHRKDIVLDGMYACPGSGSIYHTDIEWNGDIGAGSCLIT